MSIAPGKTPVSCPQCGKNLMVPQSAVGKVGRCPACTHQFRIEAPIAAAVVEPDLTELPDDDDGLPQLAPLANDSFGFQNTSNQTLQGVTPQLAAQFTPTSSPFQPPAPVNPYMAAAAASMQQQDAASKYNHGFGMEHRALDMGMLGGLLMMGIAVVWFVVGLAFDYIFFYPPILFIIGLIGMVRGMINTFSR